MAFLTTFNKRAERKTMTYQVIINDLIEAGVIDHEKIKTSQDFVDLIEGRLSLEEDTTEEIGETSLEQ